MLLGAGMSLKYTQSYSETNIINAEFILDLPLLSACRGARDGPFCEGS